MRSGSSHAVRLAADCPVRACVRSDSSQAVRLAADCPARACVRSDSSHAVGQREWRNRHGRGRVQM